MKAKFLDYIQGIDEMGLLPRLNNHVGKNKGEFIAKINGTYTIVKVDDYTAFTKRALEININIDVNGNDSRFISKGTELEFVKTTEISMNDVFTLSCIDKKILPVASDIARAVKIITPVQVDIITDGPTYKAKFSFKYEFVKNIIINGPKQIRFKLRYGDKYATPIRQS